MRDLEDGIGKAAAAFEERLPELVREIVERMQTEMPDYGERVTQLDIWEEIRRITLASRGLQLASVRAGGVLPETCPTPDLEGARRAALGGVSPTGLVLAYNIGHSSSWKAWLAAVDAIDVDPSLRPHLIAELSRLTDRYDEHVARLVADVYAAELEAARGSTNAARLRTARELIEGSSIDHAGLDYPIAATHLAVIARGARPKRELSRLAETIDGRLLAISVDEDFWWGWIAMETDEGVLGRVHGFEGAPGATLAIGGPAAGLQGFRRAHREAGYAHLVAVRAGEPLTLFADVALEAVMLRDEVEAEALVARELGPLSGGNGAEPRLIETLEAVFATGSAASAGARLGVHEQTIRRRLEQVEERIGAPISARRAELEVAMRLDRLLSGADSPAS